MSVAEIKQLPLREKLQILEAIWENMAERVDAFPVSQKTQELLDSRLERIASGQTKIHNWDDVKHSISKR